MLQLAYLRSQTQTVKERLSVKNFKEIGIIDEIIALDDEKRKLLFSFEENKSKINAASRK
jgi:seryl-tRNA synthetase